MRGASGRRFGLFRLIGRGVRWLVSTVEDGEGRVAAAPVVPLGEVLRRFWPYARSYRRWIPVILVLVALGTAVETATVWMYKVLVDEVLVPGEFGLLWWVILAYVALNVVGGMISFLDDWLSEWVGGGFVVEMRTGLYRRLMGLSLAFFERRQLGDLLSRLSGDVGAIERLVISGVVSAASYAFQLVFFAGALFYLNWRLALMSLLVVPAFWLAARFFSRRIKSASREGRRRSGSIGAVAEEGLSNVALVQAYDRGEHEVSRFHAENLAGFAAGLAATRLGAVFSPLVSLIQLLGVLVVIVVGVWQLAAGNLTIGGLLVFLVYLSMLYSPVRGLSDLVTTYYSASASAERVIEVLDQKPSVADREDAVDLNRAEGRLTFENVSFSYPGKEEPALRDVSFGVGPGETLALVGHSGSGKSTAAKLIPRFYDPDTGSVRLDGYDLRDLSLTSVRRNVSMLLQETLIFDGSVYENIIYGRPGVSHDEVVAAAKAADAHEFISQLPDGYNTVVGQKGRTLSGGQRQRIAIARAFVRDAPVLVLDEPTTGLDAASARRVLEPMERLMEGRATVVISHDPAAVRGADHVLLLDSGRVAGRGTHEELLRENQVYAELRAAGSSRTKARTP